MIVNVVKKKCGKVDLEKYYVLRGIRQAGDVKIVVGEQESHEPPTATEIAVFLLMNPTADFCSVMENYRIRGFEKVEEWH